MPTPAGLRPATAPGALLQTLAALAGATDLPPVSRGVRVRGIALDSRAVQPGDLYAALPGANAHGADYARQAARAGAAAVLTDPQGRAGCAGLGLPVLVCPRPRSVLGPLAAEVYGHPARDLLVLGVTGTNGKTTTTFLLDAALRAIGRRTGMIGTVQTRVGDTHLPSLHTTPEAPDLQCLLALMREQAVQACSIEVSSQALVQHRVDALVVDVAGFTSFSQDHLELHGDMASYLAAKALLFTPEHSRRGVVVIDDEGGRAIAERASVPVTTVSERPDAGADWWVREPVPEGATTRFTLQNRSGSPALTLRCPLPGDFNVMNTALAAVMLVTAGFDTADVVAGLAQAGGVPGRMERVSAGAPDEPLAIVDYAHTPQAVARALQALRTMADGGRLIVVLGAGGDRDPSKRAGMGVAAATWADVVVVTDDNPRGEDPAAVRAALLAGARSAGTAATILEVGERRRAIGQAVELSGPGDVLLVAGKGHEQGQEVGGVRHPFDDRVELAEALARRTAGHER